MTSWVSGHNPTVREIGEAASQRATGAKARAELGWEPTGPSLVEDLSSGSYATA